MHGYVLLKIKQSNTENTNLRPITENIMCIFQYWILTLTTKWVNTLVFEEEIKWR